MFIKHVFKISFHRFIIEIYFLFDYICLDVQPQLPIFKTHEDNYISVTSISPSIVLSSDQSKILGVSIETAIISILKQIEVSQIPISFSIKILNYIFLVPFKSIFTLQCLNTFKNCIL